ncbi:unnamed protein product [Adineta steineri]|uniref:Uncharacterized protein n=1 Tax=Adineta steineri TaxID=433720 RepID=A0A814R9V2_9BILA|nr:unnamed protein product [Adineta steineri]CAF1494740.1 unnamed protein product [Adineta steineri]CAF4133632.1 unnamed protein product [Adineta steineri]
MAKKSSDSNNSHHNQRLSDIDEKPCTKLTPIHGHDKKAVEPLVPPSTIQSMSSFHLEDKEFAAPGTYMELYCKGHPCAKCGKCRDWYYTDSASWDWIRDWQNWRSDDRERFKNNKFDEHFKRRDGGTCSNDDLFFSLYTDYYDYSRCDDGHCLCEDNFKSVS